MKYEFGFRKLSEEILRASPMISDAIETYLEKLIQIYGNLERDGLSEYPISLKALDTLHHSYYKKHEWDGYDCKVKFEVDIDAMCCIRVIVFKYVGGKEVANQTFTYLVSSYTKDISIKEFIFGVKFKEEDVHNIAERFINNALMINGVGLSYISEV